MSRNTIYIKLINSQRWKRLRADVLRSHPICQECEQNGRSGLATEVHHIVEVESVSSPVMMEQLMFRRTNLIALCHKCHAAIHKQRRSHSKEAVQNNNKRITERFKNKWL